LPSTGHLIARFGSRIKRAGISGSTLNVVLAFPPALA